MAHVIWKSFRFYFIQIKKKMSQQFRNVGYNTGL